MTTQTQRQPRRKARHNTDAEKETTSIRISTDLLDKLRADADAKDTYVSTIVCNILAQHYGDAQTVARTTFETAR